LRDAPTFAEVAEQWLANRTLDPNHNPHSLNDDRGMLKRHINPAIGHLKIKDIRKADILRLNRLMRSKTHARKYKDGAVTRDNLSAVRVSGSIGAASRPSQNALIWSSLSTTLREASNGTGFLIPPHGSASMISSARAHRNE